VSYPTLSDDEFIDAFRRCRLQPAQFDHRAHVRAAWLLAQRLPLQAAIDEVCNGIQRLATHFGAPDKFNRTLTEALVRWIASHLAVGEKFDAFIANHPALISDTRDLLGRHYSIERLTSAEAKRIFVVPDREPLPHVE